MATFDTAFYANSVAYAAVTQWAASAGHVAGEIVRQVAPTQGNERSFVCISSTSGTGTAGGSEPTWTLTRGAKNTDNTLVWQEASGIAALNGDTTNMANWTTVKNLAVSLGVVIMSNDGTKTLICTTAGTAGNGSEPSWAAYTSAGATTADNTATWTTLKDSSNKYGGWAAPGGRIGDVGAGTSFANGQTLYVSDNHSESWSGVSVNIAFAAGTAAAPFSVICVDHTASVPPQNSNVTTAAGITLTSSTNNNISFGSGVAGGCVVVVGLNFATNSGFNSSLLALTSASFTNHMRYKNCTFQIRGTNGSQLSPASGNLQLVEFENCTVSCTSGSGQFVLGGGGSTQRWRGGAVTGTPASNFFSNQWSQSMQKLEIEGVDLSTITGQIIQGSQTTIAVLKDCKLAASPTIGPASASLNFEIDVIRCLNTAGNYRNYRLRNEGTQDTELTIVRTGGATDLVTPQSWKIVTSANCSPGMPFNCQPIRIWSDITTGTHNVKVFGIWGGGAVPTNQDIWIEVEYLADSGDPLGGVSTSGQILGSSNNATDTSTWGGSTTPFAMTTTIAQRQRGYVYIYVKAGKPSTTFYIDPLPVIA